METDKLQKTLTSMMLVCSVLEDNVDKSKLSGEVLDLIKKTKKEALGLCLGFSEKEKPNCCKVEKLPSEFTWYIRSGSSFRSINGGWATDIGMASRFHLEEHAVNEFITKIKKDAHIIKINNKEKNVWFIVNTVDKRKTLGWCCLGFTDKDPVSWNIQLTSATPFYSQEEATAIHSKLPKPEKGELLLFRTPRGLLEGLKKIDWKDIY